MSARAAPHGASAPLFAAWAVALASSLVVLFIGEVLGQVPCTLCWFQRAFMFPLAVVLGVAFLAGDGGVWRYGMPLAGIGLAIAGWHTLLYVGVIPEAARPCAASGPSCTGEAMLVIGFPIPFLAALAFGTIFALLLQLRRRSPA